MDFTYFSQLVDDHEMDGARARRGLIAAMGIATAVTTTLLLAVPSQLHHSPPRPAGGANSELGLLDEPIRPIPRRAALDDRRVALGRRLFEETELSRDRTVSCASCHDFAQGGADGLQFPVGIDNQVGALNTPTVFNSSLNFRQFWDGRAASLEEQVGGPIVNPKEMDNSWDEVVNRLSRLDSYREQFAEIYPDGVTPANIADAIATFERSLVTLDAPFDRYLRGDNEAISPEALRGYGLFKEFGCISCHQGVNIGGNMFQRFGVMGNYFADESPIRREDLGRYNITGEEIDRFRFKVPGLRNVALTAPYFHDGSAETLAEAIRVMARYQLGRPIEPEQVELLQEFLKSLTGQIPETAK